MLLFWQRAQLSWRWPSALFGTAERLTVRRPAGNGPLLIRVGYVVVAITLVSLLALLNLRAHRPGDIDTTIAQLRFLQEALSDDAAEQMQWIFPEGYVFTWTLYGVASAQVARSLPPTDSRRSHHLAEAARAVQQVRSSQARSTFDAELQPPFGAFYASWSIYLRAEYIRSVGIPEVNDRLLNSFEAECAQFAAALNRSESPFLPSYRHVYWPADTAVGVAALGIHDAILTRRYGDTIARWVARARLHVDPNLGALSHAADAETGAPIGGVRGSSLALMSRVLIDADPEFAAEQYSVLRRYFVDYTWGVPGVREFPRGVAGGGDVDSGPILLGYSGPAVVVGAAAARVHGDEPVARALLGAVEVGGVPIDLGSGRRYAAGLLPVGDAFIAWSRSSTAAENVERLEWDPVLPTCWTAPAHVVSVVLAGIVLSPVLHLRNLRSRSPRAGRPTSGCS